MAPPPSPYNRIVLRFQSPWNLGIETEKLWANKFHLTGSLQLDDADAEATALALAGPILALVAAHTSLVEAGYYPGNSAVTSWEASYGLGTHPGTGSAYTQSADPQSQLEVAALARSLVGKSNRGKPVYLRKWIHDVKASNGQPNTISGLADPVALLAPWNEGAGPHNLLPISPTTGQPGDPWTIEQHLFTHQLRRGPKKKKAAAASTLDQLFKLIGTGVAAKTILEDALAALA